MDRTEVVASVAGDLYATEQAVDAAITSATTLVQSMIGARALLKVSPVAGAGSQAKAMEAIAALSAAREAIVACHTELAKDHRRLGYGVYNVGPLDKPDDADWGQGPPPPQVEQKLATVRPIRAA
ncbi:hypothetical protein ACETK8_16155 [Brevundimonas staleyi]|uniref:Uncharacterized protein n=1 Tax=Brevundimonas staleyi TaxID=74326 RepID=A0ABW0FUQ3_9CAUL